ncbi:oxygenase MpaB family protein [Kitasatospora purpeofusca]|uniref:oxygenase MpaB family protein n=1 Tax=Kitasatospora purpeofusca TaxID=67352 RepID=UPI00099D4E0B|nr:oxygenase MpaB family protein [Kitasatospora purpeofusca]
MVNPAPGRATAEGTANGPRRSATCPTDCRRRLGDALFARIAGPDGPAVRARIHTRPGPRRFGPGRAIRVVHGDASMFVGGLAALLLQSLHPVAMAAVAAHSGYRGDPWGRLQRTSTFLAVTTFGTDEDARAAIGRVRSVHARIRGTTPEGVPYRADDPHLLAWVHAAETDCFLRAHQKYGATPLDPAGCEEYVADMALVATDLGVPEPPRTRTELAEVLRSFHPELAATAAAEDAARFLLLRPPIPLVARPAHGALCASALALLEPRYRALLGLPASAGLDAAAGPLGAMVVRTIRWAMPSPDGRA